MFRARNRRERTAVILLGIFAVFVALVSCFIAYGWLAVRYGI